jgi:mycothiol synthase
VALKAEELMTARFRTYRPERDFLRIRNFLVDTYASFAAPVNWGIERWNYARHFVAPMLGSYGTDEGTPEGSLIAIRFWEDHVGLWENEDGSIVGVANIEHPDPEHSAFGELFVQRHPEHLALLDEMLAYAEQRFVDPKNRRVYVWVYEDDTVLQEVVEQRGYVKNAKVSATHLEFVLGQLPPPDPPPGYIVRTMADENDIERRREVFGRSFNHEDPREWPSAFSYRELQKAPDYQRENDLVMVAPDGTYAACCVFWYDDVNRVGHLEPVGTHPDYRRRGLAREIVFEGLRRLKALGATRVPMTGGFDPFYEAIGFRKVRMCYPWIRTFEGR